MNGINSWVKNIVVFLLLLTLIEQVLPNSDYKKYIKIAAGLILILIVFSPVLSFLKLDTSLSYYFQWENFKISAADFQAEELEAERNDYIVEQYKGNLEQQMITLFSNEDFSVAGAAVEIDEDAQSEEFGQIYSIDIRISYKETAETTVAPVVIEQVEISGDVPQENSSEEQPKVREEDSIQIKKTLASYYQVDMNQITVTAVR